MGRRGGGGGGGGGISSMNPLEGGGGEVYEKRWKRGREWGYVAYLDSGQFTWWEWI